MSLKQARFHVEPGFRYRNDSMEPFFGPPEEYVERIVEWVATCPKPQTYGCYTLFKVLHQTIRIDVLESIVTDMDEEIASLRKKLKKQAAQTEDILKIVEAQTKELREHRKAHEALLERVNAIEPILAYPTTQAEVVACVCDRCGRSYRDKCVC